MTVGGPSRLISPENLVCDIYADGSSKVLRPLRSQFISISGKAGSGKDTIKDALVDYFAEKDMVAEPYSFAGPLKDALCLWFDWDRKRLDGDYDYKEGGLGNRNPDDVDPYCQALGMTRRVIMQKFGTECMREGMHSNFWIILADLGLKLGKLPSFDLGIITDARFFNELEWTRSVNGYSIRVKRLVIETGETFKTALLRHISDQNEATLTTHTSHKSELEFEAWSRFDRIVYNPVDMNVSEEESRAQFHNFLTTEVFPEIERKFANG